MPKRFGRRRKLQPEPDRPDETAGPGRRLSRRLAESGRMTASEQELLAAIGIEPCWVLIRRPLTIAFARHAYLPGLVVGLISFAVSAGHGPIVALAAAMITGLAMMLSLIAHECGHLFLGRHARGVTPRLLLMRAVGGVSILEGRHADARGAAAFAAGGPVATLAVTVVYIAAGLLFPVGPFRTALLLPAALNFLLLGVNLLPLAPMDGWALFRSAIWASIGSRAEAERRAMRWSAGLLVYAGLISLIVLHANLVAGLLALLFLASFVAQHRVAARQLARVDQRR